jgi:hypothetical protein
MATTLHDLKYRLSRALNEIELLEVLEITTDQLVERFEDLIIEKFDYLQEEFEGEKEEDEN